MLSEKMPNYIDIEIPPEFVKDIEESKIESYDKMNILFTKAGFKPASEIDLIIKTDNEDGITEHMSEENIQKAINIIKESGLFYELRKRETKKEEYEVEGEKDKKYFSREYMNILISRSKEELDFLKRALKENSDEMLGKAFGFLPTAVEAFIGRKEKLDINTLPQEIRESDAMIFSSPTLSKDNWQEEIKQGQRNADFIKKISLKIYEEQKEIVLRSREND